MEEEEDWWMVTQVEEEDRLMVQTHVEGEGRRRIKHGWRKHI